VIVLTKVTEKYLNLNLINYLPRSAESSSNMSRNASNKIIKEATERRLML